MYNNPYHEGDLKAKKNYTIEKLVEYDKNNFGSYYV